jgi:hypothetical protein
MNKAYILSLNKKADLLKQWDFGFLKAFLEGKLWKTYDWSGFDIKSVQTLSKCEKAIVALPARHHKGLEDKVDKELNKIDKVALFLMGDEEADFDIEKIKHPNIKIWVQNPHIDKHDNYERLGTGFPPHFKEHLDGKEYPKKDIDIYFSGQITHQRREEVVDVLNNMKAIYEVELKKTAGFTQGEPHDIYANKMSRAKITPSPSGAVIPDSFRLFESLEAMSIPVADQKTPDGQVMEYWDWLLKDITPFPKVNNFNAMFDFVPDILENYSVNQHKITAWYIAYKRRFAYQVMEFLR